jgi:uncharacterized protein YheU (UPF0270 family)
VVIALRTISKHTADHLLEALLLRVAQDYEDVAEDLEAGSTEIRHAELLRE